MGQRNVGGRRWKSAVEVGGRQGKAAECRWRMVETRSGAVASWGDQTRLVERRGDLMQEHFSDRGALHCCCRNSYCGDYKTRYSNRQHVYAAVMAVPHQQPMKMNME